MSPAFSSTRQAAAFALLLTGLLLLPAVVGWIGWGDRRAVYSDIPQDRGPFPWIQSQIYSEKGDIDIAFVGSSQIMFDINTRLVRAQLSEHLGRPASVVTLGWSWPGFDPLYYVAHDLLSHRHVHTLVIYDEHRNDGKNHPFSDKPHLSSVFWFRWGEAPEALADLSLIGKLRLYAVAVFGTPRQLITQWRHRPTDDLASRHAELFNPITHAGDALEQLGSARSQLVYFWKSNFVPFRTSTPATPADVVVFGPDTAGTFSFRDTPTPLFQRHFARELLKDCKAQGTQLVVLHVPGYKECDVTTITERVPPEEYFGEPVPLIGIPTGKVFGSLSDHDRQLLFFDDFHLNQNGQDLFTPLVTPELIKVYDSAARPAP